MRTLAGEIALMVVCGIVQVAVIGAVIGCAILYPLPCIAVAMVVMAIGSLFML